MQADEEVSPFPRNRKPTEASKNSADLKLIEEQERRALAKLRKQEAKERLFQLSFGQRKLSSERKNPDTLSRIVKQLEI